MHPRLRDFVVGIVAMIALTGFAILLLLFGELASWMQSRYMLVVRANTSAGLRVGSQITLNGVVVGTITSIAIEEGMPAHPVRFEAMIDEKIRIPLDVRPGVGISLLGGGQRLDLVMPTNLPGDARMASRTTPPSEIVADLETLTEVVVRLNRALDTVQGALANAEGLFDRVGGAVERAGATFDRVGGAFDRAEGVLAKAEVWLDDDQLREDVRNTLFNARQASATIGRILDGVEQDAPKLLGSLTRASDQLSDSLTKVNALLQQARDGEGTVGRLMSNPDLYNSLNDAARRLSSVLQQAQLLLERVKQEGLDIRF